MKLLKTFLQNEKSDKREVQNIEPAELNKHLADFIRSVRRKDGEDFEPSSLSLKTINKNLNINMCIINTTLHKECFVRYLRTRFCMRNLTRSISDMSTAPAQIPYARTFHEVFSIYSYPYDK